MIMLKRDGDKVPYDYVVRSSNGRKRELELYLRRPGMDEGYLRKFEFASGSGYLTSSIRFESYKEFYLHKEWFYVDSEQEP